MYKFLDCVPGARHGVINATSDSKQTARPNNFNAGTLPNLTRFVREPLKLRCSSQLASGEFVVL